MYSCITLYPKKSKKEIVNELIKKKINDKIAIHFDVYGTNDEINFILFEILYLG